MMFSGGIASRVGHDKATVGLGSFTTNEVEFFAENELVTIVPRFALDKLHFICGDFGPFVPQTPVQVPLWLCIALKKQRKCRIQCPEWMTVDSLTELKALEKESPVGELQSLPTYYMETASLILKHGAEDIENVDRVRSLLEDIENLRQHKIRYGLHAIGAQQVLDIVYFIKLNNASSMEIHSIRSLLLATLDNFYELYANGLGLGSLSNVPQNANVMAAPPPPTTSSSNVLEQPTVLRRRQQAFPPSASHLPSATSQPQSQGGERPGEKRKLRRFRGSDDDTRT